MLPSVDIPEVVSTLFAAAKASDEFEYCCALLRLSTTGVAGTSALREANTYADQILGLVGAPIHDDLKIRLYLTLYCHLTESDDIYSVLINMLNIVEGKRYSCCPLEKQKYPSDKLQVIRNAAHRLGFLELVLVADNLLLPVVRNAFFHSDYCLHKGEFHIIRGEKDAKGRDKGVLIDGAVYKEIPLRWLTPRLNFCVNFILGVLDTLIGESLSYCEDKIVKGRMADDSSYTDVQLLTKKDIGLIGFRVPPVGQENGGTPAEVRVRPL